MSDSDAEFEKFLQESLSSSTGSYMSGLTHSRNLSTANTGRRSQNWYRRTNQETTSDHELDVAGQSWLKKSGPLGNSRAVSVDITLPSTGVDYSKDSLESSKEDSQSSQLQDLLKSKSVSGSSIQDTFSFSQKSTSTSGPSTGCIPSSTPGFDTLQEDADKERFFADLERDRNSPPDYSELNQQLENTGKLLLPDTVSTIPVVPKETNYSEKYEDDFESIITESETSLSSQSNSTSTITPTNSNHELVVSSLVGVSKDGNSPEINHELHSQGMIEGNLSNASTDLNTSGSSDVSTQSVRRLLHRSSISSTLQRKEQLPSNIKSQSTTGFSLSPIESQMLVGCNIGESMKATSEQNDTSESLTHRSSFSETVDKYSLAPICSKDLITAAHVGEQSASEGTKNQSKMSSYSAEGFFLSPIQEIDSCEQGRDKESVSSPTKASKQTTSPLVKEVTGCTRKDIINKGIEVDSVLPLHQSVLSKVPQMPHQLNEHLTDYSPLGKTGKLDNIGKKDDSFQHDYEVTGVNVVQADQQSVLPEDKSYLSDLTELQNALRAAGLPQITVENKSATTDTSNITILDESTDDIANGLPSAKAAQDSVSINQAEMTMNTMQGRMQVTNQSAVVKGTGSAVIGTSSAVKSTSSAVIGTSSAVIGTSSAVKSTSSAVIGAGSAVKGTSGAVRGASSTVRDAVRVLANQELANITRDILQSHKRTKGEESSTDKSNSKPVDGVQKNVSLASLEQNSTHDLSLKKAYLEGSHPPPKDSDSNISTHRFSSAHSQQTKPSRDDETNTSSISPHLGREGNGSELKRELSNLSKPIKKKSNANSLTGKHVPLSRGNISTQEKKVKGQLQRSQVKLSPRKVSKSATKSGPPSKQSNRLTSYVQRVGPPKPPTSLNLTSSLRPIPGTGNSWKIPPKGAGARASNESSAKNSSPLVIPTGKAETVSELEDSNTECSSHSDSRLDKTDNILVWQKAWEDEKTRNEELCHQMKELEGRFHDRENKLNMKFEEEQSELKQEIYSLSTKLKDLETSQDLRKLLASGLDIGDAPVSREDKVALQSSIQQQEVLLQGYQKENERLYSSLTKLQKELKLSQSRLYEDNQKLRKELLDARSELERLPAGQSHSTSVDSQFSNSTRLGAARISQLEDKLEVSNEKCTNLEKQVIQLKHTCSCLEQEVRTLSQEKKDFVSKARDLVDRKEIYTLKEKHKAQTLLLTQKLEWYAENQTQLDKDCELMKEKDKDISSLREKLSTLEKSSSKRKGLSEARSRSAEANRVVQLERQVKELEKVIQKRFPNSLSALILASNRERGLDETSESIATVRTDVSKVMIKDGLAPPSKRGALPTQVFMEKRVQQLEEVLAARDKDESKRLRALQQRYTAMELAYEKQLTALRDKLEEQGPSSTNSTDVGEITHVLSHEDQFLPPSSRAQDKEGERESRGTASKGNLSTTGGSERKQIQLTSLMEEVKEENSQLKEKLEEISFLLAHQRIQYQGMLAEAEGKLARSEERAQEKYQKLEKSHRATVDSLVSKWAREYSQSKAVHLASQLAARDATILHLKEKIDCLEFKCEQLANSKCKEETLAEQIQLLQQQLIEAKRHHSPEMQHFLTLHAKISNLEERCVQYELLVQEKWSKLHNPLQEKQLKELEYQWKSQLNTKDAEIEHFRQELDSMIGTLKVLQQGNLTHHND